MPFTKIAVISAIGLMAVPAFAQQFVSVPCVTVIAAPGQPSGQTQPMPDAFQVMDAQMAQMNAMMQAMDAQMAAQMAAMPQMPATPAAFGNLPAGVTGIAITTITDGAKSCTERVLYPATGAQKIQVSESGNACGALTPSQPAAIPTASPIPAAPVKPAAPTTIQVENNSSPQPIMLASRD